jgi:hypothetical protein
MQVMMLNPFVANRQQYDDATFIGGIKSQFDFKLFDI